MQRHLSRPIAIVLITVFLLVSALTPVLVGTVFSSASLTETSATMLDLDAISEIHLAAGNGSGGGSGTCGSGC